MEAGRPFRKLLQKPSEDSSERIYIKHTKHSAWHQEMLVPFDSSALDEGNDCENEERVSTYKRHFEAIHTR